MVIKAIISTFRTVPFTKQELEQMPSRIYSNIENYGLEKVIEKQVIGEIIIESFEELKKKVLEINERKDLDSLIVETTDDTITKNSFIVPMAYDERDPNAIFESILYLSDEKPQVVLKKNSVEQENFQLAYKGLELFKRHLLRDRNLTEEEQELVHKGLELFKRHLLRDRNLTEEEQELAEIFKQQAQNQPFPELQSLVAEITAIEYYKKTNNTDLSKLEAQNSGAILSKTEKAYKSRPISSPMPTTSPHYWNGSENATVLCRIIGKDLKKNQRFEEYYKAFHGIWKMVRKETNVISQSNDAWTIPT